jgi:hypothetical protein
MPELPGVAEPSSDHHEYQQVEFRQMGDDLLRGERYLGFV